MAISHGARPLSRTNGCYLGRGHAWVASRAAVSTALALVLKRVDVRVGGEAVRWHA